MLVPVIDARAADVFRRLGWQVTKVPIAAFTETELRTMGVQLGGHPPCRAKS
jgi:hypothetical protein